LNQQSSSIKKAVVVKPDSMISIIKFKDMIYIDIDCHLSIGKHYSTYYTESKTIACDRTDSATRKFSLKMNTALAYIEETKCLRL